MNRKRPRKDISYVSKRYFNRLIAHESEVVRDSLLNTIASSRSDNCVYSDNLENDSTINLSMKKICNETVANENGTIYEGNKNNITKNYEYKECLQSNQSDSESCVSISDELEHVSSENVHTTLHLKNSIAVWATEHQISHTAIKALLQRLKQHSCFLILSFDARSLLKTPRKQKIRIVPPGTYYHFGLLHSILEILTFAKDTDIDCVKIAINVDGLPLTKSSSQQFWPILGSVLPYDNVFLIGLYHGNEKPANANDFLKDFIDEAKNLCENGININGRNILCRLEALICDTPAKAFVLCVKGHSGYHSCTKCQIEGEYIGNRICFPQVDAPLRTDEDFFRKIDENYHKPDITCSLLKVPHFQPVTNVPLDYMHLVCLGIMRKLINLWLDGELRYRLSSRAVKEISTRLITQLKPSIPVEFARKPRAMNCVKMWKATEYRLILLYTGPLAFKSI